MTDSLKFSQGYIGILGSIASAGWVLGALLYRRFFGELTLKNLLNLSIVFGTLTTAAFVLLSNEVVRRQSFISARGFSAMLATVATLTLAADYCPPRAEGFAFAVLMSIINLAIDARRQRRLISLHPYVRQQSHDRWCWSRRLSPRLPSCWCRCFAWATSGKVSPRQASIPWNRLTPNALTLAYR